MNDMNDYRSSNHNNRLRENQAQLTKASVQNSGNSASRYDSRNGLTNGYNTQPKSTNLTQKMQSTIESNRPQSSLFTG
jgi:hypothetical protein